MMVICNFKNYSAMVLTVSLGRWCAKEFIYCDSGMTALTNLVERYVQDPY